MMFLDQISRFMAEETRGEPASRGNDMLEKIQPKGNARGDLYDRLHVSKQTFDARLTEMIADPPNGSVSMTITPSMAADMLKRNDRNRPVSAALVKFYAKQMRANDWHYTRVPLIFSDQGRLIDGQHRLLACVEAETAIKADVVFGSPDEAFAYIDVGKKRTGGDIFAINGVQNAPLMAAATVWVVSYDRNTIGGISGGNASIPAAECYEHFSKYAKMQDSAWVGHMFAKSHLASPSLMTALHYICSRKSRHDADDFFTRLGDGVGIEGKTDPANVMRNKLITNLSVDEKMSKRRIAALTIRAWNAHRAGRPMKALAFGGDEAFPRAR